MPSPNGYFDYGTFTDTSRNSFRFQLTYDITNPPWDEVQAGSYTWLIEYSTTAVGPWTTAPLATNLSNPCSPSDQPNPTIGLVGDTNDALFHINDIANIVHDQDYFVRVTLFDPTATQVDQFVSPAFHTPDYPTIVCVNTPPQQTQYNGFLGNTNGDFNLVQPCSADSVIWEIATVSGGPYTPEPSAFVTSPSPQHLFTGLTPGTQYFYRARFSEQVESMGEFLVSPECTFTTLQDPAAQCDPATNLLPLSATINGRTLDDGAPGDVAHFEWGTTPGGPYPNVTPDVPAATAGSFSANLTGLTADTPYYYRVVWERGNTILDTSDECTFTTTHWCMKAPC